MDRRSNTPWVYEQWPSCSEVEGYVTMYTTVRKEVDDS